MLSQTRRALTILAVLVTLTLIGSVRAADGFGPKEVDPTAARGETAHASDLGWMPFSTAPRRKWTVEEADEFFSHPSVQSRPEFGALKKFLFDNGFHASKLQLRWDTNQGYFFVATQPATMLEELLSVPGKIFFHIYHPNLHNNTKYMMNRLHEYFWGPGLESEVEDLARISLIITLMAETRNPESFWAPYLAILQRPVLPFMLTESERDRLELGRPSAFLQSKNRLKEDIGRVMQAPEFRWLQNEAELLDWAIATVGSRTFSWGLGKFGNHLVMMPGMDFINHNNDVVNHYEYTENQDLRYLIPNSIKPGDELAIAYLPQATNMYLFQEYGFVLNRNVQDHISITFAPELQAVLKAQTYELPRTIVLGYDDHVNYKFIRAINVAVLNGPDAVTSAAYDELKNVLEAELKSFSTTMADDEARLKDPSITKTDQLIITFRVEMKRMLHAAIATVEADRQAFQSRGIDAVVAFKGNRQPADVYLDEPMRVVVIKKKDAAAAPAAAKTA